MKIAILTTSLTLGGAAIVTSHLARALTDAGNEVMTFSFPDGAKRERQPSFLAERLGIFLRNGMRRDTLFKVSTADFGRCGILRQVETFSPDAIILGWINQGLLSLDQIAKLGQIAPITWVMHDMWNFTGICHHSLGCLLFSGHCGNCPMLSRALRRPSDLSNTVWRRKKRLYDSLGNVKFIAVSSWVKDMARRSSLLRDRRVEVIPNVYSLDRYYIGEKERGLIVMGAARLDDPIKGLHHAVTALNLLPPDLDAHVVFFGQLRDNTLLQKLKIPYELAGELAPEEVAELMSRAQVVLSTSLYETLGNTLIEGQASGAVPVAFDRGGQVDIIDMMKTGYLAPFGDAEAIARGVEWALSGRVMPESLRAAALSRFSAPAVAARYLSLL